MSKGDNRESRRTFFVADTHLGHGNIVKYCGRNQFLAEYDSKELLRRGGTWHDGDWKGDRASNWRISRETIEMMDDTIINNINKLVKEDDILYHLGDFCFAPKNEYFRVASNYRRRINCKEVYLIFGNHDNYSIGSLFTNAYDMLSINVNKQHIVLSHYAMAVWDKSHRGAFHLYGHSHSNAEQWLDKVMPGRRSIDVGVDNAAKILGEYRPFSFEEIMKIMSKKEGFHFDHHGMRKGPTEEDLIG